MLPRYLVLAVLAPCLFAAVTNTLEDVANTVREGLEQNRSDQQIAHALHRLNLKVRLDNRAAEELESMAPGPKSIAELERLRELTHDLPLSDVEPSFPSPPPPTSEELHHVMAEASHKALNYSASLPDFICTENIRRYEGATGKADWVSRDSLTVQLTYFDHEENYKLTALNKHKTGLTYDEVGGALSKGEFASMLLSIFVPTTQTRFQFLNWTRLRMRTAYVFGFRIEAKNSTYVLRVGRMVGEVSTVPGRHGYIYIDRETNDILRVDSASDSIPADFPLSGATTTLDYGPAEVGGRTYMLPLRAEVRMISREQPLVTRNEVEFTDFRKFTGESTISFGDTVDQKPDDKTKPNPPVKK